MVAAPSPPPSPPLTEVEVRFVPVPSSEIVAMIVGRQGTKIKALRNETQTWIRTPLREEQPVFWISGSKDGVDVAQEKILSEARHFSELLVCGRNKVNKVTIGVFVASHWVKLVEGDNGSVINRIQQDTNTSIKTPSCWDDIPIFEVTGTPKNVKDARRMIDLLVSWFLHKQPAPYNHQKDVGDSHQPNGNVGIIGSGRKLNRLLNNCL